MSRKKLGLVAVVVGAAVLLSAYLFEMSRRRSAVAQTNVEAVPASGVVELKVRVVDPDGKPVAKAKVSPWALRSSQGHGLWRKDDKQVEFAPKDVTTDAKGNAVVAYPYYHDRKEQVRAIGVSVMVDHPDFAHVDAVHIDVPLEKEPHEIKLAAGVPVELRPLLDDKPVDLDQVYVFWSDGRSMRPGAAPPKKTADGRLQIAAMPAGGNSVLVVKLDGDRATHFSKITDFKLAVGKAKKIDIPLRPSVRVRGSLSANVPRPVRAGRLKASTLDPVDGLHNRVSWWTWAPIQPDGTFTIDGWPAGEPLQLIALCDGYIAKSGRAPKAVKVPPDPKKDWYCRPQVFELTQRKRIELAMTPLARCEVTALDDSETPVVGVAVQSCPNVGWWNNGSQIYCDRLARAERAVQTRDYFKSIDEAFPFPFTALTDAQGKAVLQLPAGDHDIAVDSEVYELPIFLGWRDVRIKLVAGQTTQTVLRLQPRGTEKLGEWDKLAGVVFGCSTREGRRICALPGVQKKMNEFAKRFREGKNQRDPKLLAEAYSAVADAFDGVGDVKEAAKWRGKAAEQAKKAKSMGQSANKG